MPTSLLESWYRSSTPSRPGPLQPVPPGRGEMLDHMLITRNLLAHYRGSEIHNDILQTSPPHSPSTESIPESDHAPVVATFDF
jgi:exonuclease III